MKRDVDGILYEALVVALVGFCAALTANHFSPKGIKLTRNYFPSGEPASGGEVAAVPRSQTATTNSLAARLQSRNLTMVGLAEAEELYRDPRHETEQVVFIDARSRQFYEEGHVPGAFHLDHFYPETTLSEVLPVVLSAEIIVVYCNGGDCEDSEFTAVFLREAGVPDDRMRVYGGGMEEWRLQGLPVELGHRRSGRMEAP
jgi:rhodanese-related sulfurtransferase